MTETSSSTAWTALEDGGILSRHLDILPVAGLQLREVFQLLEAAKNSAKASRAGYPRRWFSSPPRLGPDDYSWVGDLHGNFVPAKGVVAPAGAHVDITAFNAA